MSSLLMRIQPEAMRYADILSGLLKVEVTIVDKTLHRVAGAGHTFAKEAQKQADVSKTAGLLSQTLQSGQVRIYENPGEYETCKNCEEAKRCLAKYQMSAPIMVNGKAEGVLAFMTSNQVEKERLLKKKELYLEFLVEFADLLSLKLLETGVRRERQAYMELLKIVLDCTDTGVLVFDKDRKLVLMNCIGRRLLPVRGALPVKAALKVLKQGNEKSEILLTLEERKYRLAGKLHHVCSEDYSDIFIFADGISTEAPENLAETGSDIRRILGNSEAAVKIRKKILQYAGSKAIVLITGDSGTEKVETAQVLHEESPWNKKPFVVLNCRDFSDEALEKELFGTISRTTKRGRQGKFEQASEGTLLLEEIDSLSLSMQAKLLRVLKEGRVTRVGGSKAVRIHARIVVTATKNLGEMMAEGSFLEGLFYHLFVLPIHIPPLRERKEDIRIIGKEFLMTAARKNGKTIMMVEPLFWSILEKYPWPGNVWQLKAAMEYIVNAMEMDGMVTADLIPENILAHIGEACEPKPALEFNLKKLEEATIRKALETFGSDARGKELAAEKLGIGIATLYRKMKQYQL
ncbi:MAG: sigma 54-interacting transcriptional regulator [Lachnospiraceae bacterium]|nr:sigma 54-interacting transcriptional regulator [Lachnospiraceae bacterium]